MQQDRDDRLERIADAIERMAHEIAALVGGIADDTTGAPGGDPFPQWNGSDWSGLEPYVPAGQLTMSRILASALAFGDVGAAWPQNAADTRTDAERHVWRRAAHLVEGHIDSPNMEAIVAQLRRRPGSKRVTAVLEQRFRVPHSIVETPR